MSLVRELRRLIAGGYLAAGSRVPSTRSLARDLGVSRNSVLAAFERLADEGLIVSRHGSGSFVSRFAGRSKPACAPAELDPLLRPSQRAHASVRQHVFPAVEHFPVEAWQRCLRAVAGDIGTADLLGVSPLPYAIAEHLALARGVRCAADQIAVFATREEALEFAIRIATECNEPIASTDADEIADAARAAGVRIVGADATARLIHCAHSGSRAGVLPIARREHAWVLEDDLYGHFATERSLHSLAPQGRVIYLGGFADVLYPLDVTFLVLPQLLTMFVRHSVSIIEQRVLARFIAEGHLAAHIRRLRTMVRARRQVVVARLQDAGVEWVDAPLHVEVRTGTGTTLFRLADLFPPNVEAIAGRRRIA